MENIVSLNITILQRMSSSVQLDFEVFFRMEVLCRFYAQAYCSVGHTLGQLNICSHIPLFASYVQMCLVIYTFSSPGPPPPPAANDLFKKLLKSFLYNPFRRITCLVFISLFQLSLQKTILIMYINTVLLVVPVDGGK